MHERDDVMITSRQLAERWQTSIGRLANLRYSGRGPDYIRLGAAIRYPLAAIQRYETAHTVESLDSLAEAA